MSRPRVTLLGSRPVPGPRSRGPGTDGVVADPFERLSKSSCALGTVGFPAPVSNEEQLLRRRRRPTTRSFAAVAVVALLAAACGNGTEPDVESEDPAMGDVVPDDAVPEDGPGRPPEAGADLAGLEGSLTVYSGRSEELVGEVFAAFEEATDVDLQVRYGDTAELAATILEEGDASPADLFFAQDAGALGALEVRDSLALLPEDARDLVAPNFRAPSGAWTGVTGRVRVLAYNTDELTEDEVPDSVLDLVDGEWEGRVGWAPTNGSFQAFVTAMRITEGEDTARQWLTAMLQNGAVPFENNTALVEGVARGEVDLALTNHYYRYRFLAEDPGFNVDNKYLPGDIGGLVNVAGIGVLATSDEPDAAFGLVRYLVGEETQTYFGQVTDAPEFPLRDGIASPQLPDLGELDPPEVDLSQLEDLQGTLELLQDVGALQ
jgi:iron(III) transport system substrate-binding protein